MYRILIACVLIIQAQSRPFGTIFFGGGASLPWLSQPFPNTGIFKTISIHQNAYFPFSQYPNSVNTLRQAPQLPPRNYGRYETHFPLDFQPFYGSSAIAPSFIPSNGFNLNNQKNEFASRNYQFPADSFALNNGPQFAPEPYAGTSAPLCGPPVSTNPPSNTFIAANGPVNRFESTDYRPSKPNYNPTNQSPFQLIQPG